MPSSRSVPTSLPDFHRYTSIVYECLGLLLLLDLDAAIEVVGPPCVPGLLSVIYIVVLPILVH